MPDPEPPTATSGDPAPAAPHRGPDPVRLYFAVLNEVGIIAQLARAQFEHANRERVSLPQFTVLNHLVRLGDGRTPFAIADAFQVPRASMTNTLQGLERAGLIETRAHPTDGRSKLVHLTHAGRAMREACIAALAPALGRIAAEFVPADADRLLPELARLRAALDAQRA